MHPFITVFLLLPLFSINLIGANILDTSQIAATRYKRALIFNRGLNWAQMVIGVGVPVSVSQHALTAGVALKSYYRLPTDSSEITNPNLVINNEERKKRSLFSDAAATLSRWDLYSGMETYFRTFYNDDFKSCFLLMICEAAEIPVVAGSSMFGDIMHLFMTPSSTKERPTESWHHEYIAAEQLGRKFAKASAKTFFPNDCRSAYPDCKTNYFDKFTQIL